MKWFNLSLLTGLCVFSLSSKVDATFLSLTNVTGANDAIITTTPPNPVSANPNNGLLLAWDEMQNVTLTENLKVDRVADPGADYIVSVPGGGFEIVAGTIVTSHYLQWDPGNGSSSRVTATINLDSEIFALITSDQNLFDTDEAFGLPGLDYNDFPLLGIERGDFTDFMGSSLDISWGAGSPGDWARLIAAFSPQAAHMPEPSTMVLLSLGVAGMGYAQRRRRKAA